MSRCRSKGLSLFVLIIILAGVSGPLPAQESKAGDAKQQEDTATFTREELEQIVAPIALHPDELVSQILMASTYPLEVVQANRWIKEHKNLKGDDLAKALEKEDWDPSVKSLVQFPDLLERMSDKLDWTQKLGDAVLADQGAVLDAIQLLRNRAYKAGNLKDSKEQKIIVEDAPKTETQTVVVEKIIKIEPANPEVIYVPSYNPTVVYGAWPYPAYPPYSYYPPSYVYPPGYGFVAGVALGVAWGYAWGGFHWGGHGHHNIDVDINRNFNWNKNINRDRYRDRRARDRRARDRRGNRPRDRANRGGGRGKWQHNPRHRKGARYRDNRTAQKFGRPDRSRQARNRQQFRGRANRSSPGARNRAGARTGRAGASGARNRAGSGRRSSALGGAKNGRTARRSSARGKSSRHRSYGGGSRSGRSRGGATRGGSRGRGSFGGARRGGGGARRGGGGRRR